MKKTLNLFTACIFTILLVSTMLFACETPADPEGTSPAEVTATVDQQSDKIYQEVDQYPSLLDKEAFYADIKYPEVAKNAGIEGRVLVEFIVDKEGNVTDATVKKGIGAGCDEEALRALEATRFQPGIHNGKPVKVKMVMPFTFKLPA